uniref:hypothetical protein n=1 Tax=Sphaeromyxa zaharoni TaxID=275449 RepID=UPI003002A1F2
MKMFLLMLLLVFIFYYNSLDDLGWYCMEGEEGSLVLEEGLRDREVDSSFFWRVQERKTVIFMINKGGVGDSGFNVLVFLLKNRIYIHEYSGYKFILMESKCTVLMSKGFGSKSWIPFVRKGLERFPEYNSRSLWIKYRVLWGDSLSFTYFSKKYGGFRMRAVYSQKFYKEKSQVLISYFIGKCKWIKKTVYRGKLYKRKGIYKLSRPLVKYKFPKHLYMEEAIHTQRNVGYNTADVCIELPRMNWFTSLKAKCPWECWIYPKDEELVDNYNYGVFRNKGREYFGLRSALAYCRDPYQRNSERIRLFFFFKRIYYNYIYSGSFVEGWRVEEMEVFTYDSIYYPKDDLMSTIYYRFPSLDRVISPVTKSDIAVLSRSLKTTRKIFIRVKSLFFRRNAIHQKKGAHYIYGLSGMASLNLGTFNYDKELLNLDFYRGSFRDMVVKRRMLWETCYAPCVYNPIVQVAQWWWHNRNWWKFKKDLSYSVVKGLVGTEAILEQLQTISSPFSTVSNRAAHGVIGGTPYYDGVVEELAAFLRKLGKANLRAQLILNPRVFNVPLMSKGEHKIRLRTVLYGEVRRSVKRSMIGSFIELEEGRSYDLKEFDVSTLREVEGEGDDF